MAPHRCEQCDAVVAEDEQFCPSCGAFIDPMASDQPRPRPQPRPTGNVISVSSDGSYEEFSLSEPPSAPESQEQPPSRGGGGEVHCPSCGAANPSNNRHCQECGARLHQGPLPTAPRPAVQATAGVRAALAISGLLLAVIIIALIFNFGSGDPSANTDTSTSTSAPTGTTVLAQPGPVTILDEVCTPEGISNLICDNLTNGEGTEYQVSWEETVAEEGEVTIFLTFEEPIAISSIRWVNINDETRFRQNYRAESLTILAQDSLSVTPVELRNIQGTQDIPFVSLETATLEIKVVSAYPPEVVNDNIFDELAIDEIVVIGRPVISTEPAPSTTTTTTG